MLAPIGRSVQKTPMPSGRPCQSAGLFSTLPDIVRFAQIGHDAQPVLDRRLVGVDHVDAATHNGSVVTRCLAGRKSAHDLGQPVVARHSVVVDEGNDFAAGSQQPDVARLAEVGTRAVEHAHAIGVGRKHGKRCILRRANHDNHLEVRVGLMLERGQQGSQRGGSIDRVDDYRHGQWQDRQ